MGNLRLTGDWRLRGDIQLIASYWASLKPSVHYMYRTVVSGQYMYRTVVTIYTAQWSLYVPQIGQYMYRTVVTVCTAQWSLYVPHSSHYMYRTVVTICTTSLIFTNFTFCPHSGFMCFVWICEQTAIISLYSTNWLVFITDTDCVYCAVRTGFLYRVQVNFRPSGSPTMAPAFSRRPHSSGPGSIPDRSVWDLRCTEWQWDRVFSQYSSFPLSVSFHHCSILIHSSTTHAV